MCKNMTKMKINLHCHTDYSDGNDSIYDMAQEHQRHGFSAFVVTDHVQPLHLETDRNEKFPRSIVSYDLFQRQAQELENVSKQLNFPCIQGMELGLFGEEVLVFGDQASRDIFRFMDKLDFTEKYADINGYRHKVVLNLIDMLRQNKEHTATILCHPHLDPVVNWVLEPLYPVLDGYEFQNRGCYYFKDSTVTTRHCWARPIPPELANKNKFCNSDAHSLRSVLKGNGNFHTTTIKTLSELITYIKQPHSK